MYRRLLFVLTLCTILAFGITSCGAPSTPFEEATEVALESKPTEVELTEPSEPTEIVEEENTLVVAVSDEISTLDWSLGRAFPRMTELLVNCFGKLLDSGTIELPDGMVVGDAFKNEPMLVESYEVSDDGLVWTFHLREGMKHYPSGNEITAHDFYWTMLREPGLEVPDSLLYLVGIGTPEEPIKGIEVIDKYTVRITSYEWNTILPSYLNIGLYFADSEEYKSHATDDDPWATEWAKTHMTSSGPYFIESRTPGEQTVLRRNPNWPLEEPFFDRIILRIVPSSANRVLLLKAGEVDIAQDLTVNESNALEGTEGVKIVSSPIGDMIGILMNNEMEPFDDVRVRQAVAYMVDYDEIIETVYRGRAIQARSPIPSMVPSSDYSHWIYDLPEDEAIAKAKQLLADAGYEDGVEFTLSVNLGIPEFQTMALLIQSELARADITVNIEELPLAAFAEKRNNAQLQAFLDALLPWIPDPGYGLSLLWGCGSIGASWNNYCNVEVDELIELAKVEQDDAKRAELYSEAQKLIVEDAPWAFIAARNFNAAMREDISGYVHFPDSRYRYWLMYRE
jgi:peptide/nickel transport system substrate-binding protein